MKATTTPHGEKGVFHNAPIEIIRIKQKSTQIKASKSISKKYQNLDFLIILTSQILPKTPPKPSQIEPKRPLGRLLGPLGPSWQQSLKKRSLKVPQETPRSSRTPPKTLPKPAPNLSKIDSKTYAKNITFLEPFFSRFSSIWASKTTYFSMIFWCMLASNFHWFLGPFRLPNPLALGACSIPFNIEREKWDFRKICIFHRENHYLSGFEHRRDQQIQETIDETTQWKCIENPYDFNHRFYQKSIKIR